MKLANILNKFRNDESGAVTVDWVVLTAAIVGLGVLVVTQISGAIGEVTADMAKAIGDTETGTTTAFDDGFEKGGQ
ncbi:Flp family type IVb pilin [Falsigemmobacter intermedius]|uniref:Pilus assembly protein n=1 Tax=Falsigemmobacter intermedius TaxID=1553448 RepID=A0A444MCD6_9RHOB|nr:pilus assembly protein [Falsigemmobacter intermedius]RWY41695.1 pilus assembly protein [Falsigemmobacter intermedius]